MALYPEKQIRDVAALPSIRGRDFVANLVEQADTYDPTYLLGRQAVTLEHVDGSPVLTLDDGTVLRAGAVVVTAGIGTPTPRPLGTGDEWLGTRPVVLRRRPVAARRPGRRHRRRRRLRPRLGRRARVDRPVGHARPPSCRIPRPRRHPRPRALRPRRDPHRHRGRRAASAISTAERAAEGGSAGQERQRDRRRGDHVIAALGFISDLGPLREWGLELLRTVDRRRPRRAHQSAARVRRRRRHRLRRARSSSCPSDSARSPPR